MRSLRRYTGRRVMIQTSDQTLDGTLERADRDALVMTQSSLLTTGADPVRLDGEVALPVAAIRWVQVV